MGNAITEFEDGFERKRFGPVGVKNTTTDLSREGGTLRFEIFKISKLMKSCILMQMGPENHNMTSNVENLTPTLIFETRRRRLKFGVVLRILV